MLKIGISVKIQTRMANSVDPDAMAHYEPSYLYLYFCTSSCFGLSDWNGYGCRFTFLMSFKGTGCILQIFCHYLEGVGGGNLCDFMFAFLHTKPLLARGLL